MALNRQTFKIRTGTAILFAAVMLTGLLWNQWSFFILLSVIHFGCWIEYQKLTGLINKDYREITPFHQYGIMLAGWCLLCWFAPDEYKIFTLSIHESGWWMGLLLIFLLPVTEVLFTKNIQLKNTGFSLSGLLYISLSLGLMVTLYRKINIPVQDTIYTTREYFIPVVIIAAIWINDTMAYIIGSLAGKTPLTKISPKKTWEGTIGGIILSIAVTGLVSYYGFHYGKFTVHLLAIAGITSISGTFGDLFESKLKRLAGVKDSGSLMPGHGGFLDRFDSLLFAIPFVWLYVQLFIDKSNI